MAFFLSEKNKNKKPHGSSALMNVGEFLDFFLSQLSVENDAFKHLLQINHRGWEHPKRAASVREAGEPRFPSAAGRSGR